MRRNVLLLVMIALTIFWGYEKFTSEKPAPSGPGHTAVNDSTPQSKAASAHHAEGLKFYNEGKYKEAIDEWRKEAELVPKNANTVNNIGIAYSGLGDYDSAIEYHKKAIELDPNFGHAYHSLALAYASLKDYQQAKENYKKAIELKYANGDSYYGLGYAAMKLNECEEAVEAFKKAINMNSAYAFAQGMMGDCYKSSGKSDLARAEYEKEIARNPDGSLKSRIGILQLDALADPNNADLWFQVGTELKKIVPDLEDYKEAVKAFKEVIRINDSYPGAHYELGQLYERFEDIENSQNMAKSEYIKELEFHPEYQDAADALTKLNEKAGRGVKLSKVEFTEDSPFKKIQFPQIAIVVKDPVEVFDSSLENMDHVSLDPAVVTVKAVYERPITENSVTTYEFIYALSEPHGFVSARDVILKNTEVPIFTFANKSRIIESPIGHHTVDGFYIKKYVVWLKAVKKEYIFIGEYEIGMCVEPVIARVSNNEKFAYITNTNTLLSADGALVWKLPDAEYTSPVWIDNRLFLRGFGENDAVYVLDPETKEIQKFMDIPDGQRINYGMECIMTWEPIKFEKGIIKASFLRADPNPTDETKMCMNIEVTADKNGTILKKDIKWDQCD